MRRVVAAILRAAALGGTSTGTPRNSACFVVVESEALATRTFTYVGGTTFAAGEIWLSFRILFENKGLNWVRFVFWFWVRRPFRNQRLATTGMIGGGSGCTLSIPPWRGTTGRPTPSDRQPLRPEP
jgi:hypothetical protein